MAHRVNRRRPDESWGAVAHLAAEISEAGANEEIVSILEPHTSTLVKDDHGGAPSIGACFR